MNHYLLVLAIALLPAAGNFAGGLLAETLRPSPWFIGAALHGAAGVAIAVVSIELMPRALDALTPWLLAAAFIAGAGFSIALSQAVSWGRRLIGSGSRGAWMICAAIAADLTSDGLMVGAGTEVSGRLGLLLAASQVVANVPGGFAAISNLREDGMPRRHRLLIGALLALPAVLGASVGFWLLRSASPEAESIALSLIAGVLLLATIEDMVPQADEPQVARWISTTAFATGFAFLTVLSGYLG